MRPNSPPRIVNADRLFRWLLIPGLLILGLLGSALLRGDQLRGDQPPVAQSTAPESASARAIDQQNADSRPLASESSETGAQTEKSTGVEPRPPYRTELIRGEVTWLSEVLDERFGITTVPEVSESVLALVSKDGQIHPLVENTRGRAFRKDKRLRNQDMQIVVRRHDQQPMVQVLRIYQWEEGKKYEIDYWCDVCAIPMYETGPCSCCQDHNRLRKRPVNVDSTNVDDGVAESGGGVDGQ